MVQERDSGSESPSPFSVSIDNPHEVFQAFVLDNNRPKDFDSDHTVDGHPFTEHHGGLRLRIDTNWRKITNYEYDPYHNLSGAVRVFSYEKKEKTGEGKRPRYHTEKFFEPSLTLELAHEEENKPDEPPPICSIIHTQLEAMGFKCELGSDKFFDFFYTLSFNNGMTWKLVFNSSGDIRKVDKIELLPAGTFGIPFSDSINESKLLEQLDSFSEAIALVIRATYIAKGKDMPEGKLVLNVKIPKEYKEKKAESGSCIYCASAYPSHYTATCQRCGSPRPAKKEGEIQ